MLSLYARIAAVIAIGVFLAGIYWRGHTQGYKARDLIAQADIAQRTADALQASEQARKVEQELSAKVGRIDRAYQDQKRATATVASAAAVGLSNLEAILTKSNSTDPSATDTSGIAGADPRPAIARECVRQLGALDEAYGKLADKARALQEISGVLRVKP
jgi:hypothetical protein